MEIKNYEAIKFLSDKREFINKTGINNVQKSYLV